jgi:hypothetical protein
MRWSETRTWKWVDLISSTARRGSSQTTTS